MNEIVPNTHPIRNDIFSKGVIALSLSTKDIVYMLLCYVMSSCTFFDGRVPFVLSAYAASFALGRWYLPLAASVLGLLRLGMGFNLFMYLAVLGGATFLMGTIRSGRKFKAICVSSLLFVVSFTQNLVTQAFWYDYFITFLEVGLCYGGVYTFSVAVPLITDAKDRRCILDTELVSLFILLALVVRCSVGLGLVAGLDISVVLSILLLLAINMESDISLGTAMGVVLGFITVGGAVSPVVSVGAFSFASLCAGVFNRFGKWGVVLGFACANATLSAFFPEEILPFDIFEVLSSAIIFALLPKKITGYISSVGSKTVHTATKAFIHRDKVQKLVSKRLMLLSNAYYSLADSYDKSFKTDTMSKEYIIHMLDSASSKICPDCGLKYNCWERHYKESYKAMSKMLETADKKGTLTVEDAPSPIKDKCIKIKEFVDKFNEMYGIYKVEKMWQGRLNDARKLVSEQLRGISRSVKDTADKFDMCIDTAAEKEIKSALDRNKIDFLDVTFLKGRTDGFCVEILLGDYSVSKKTQNLIEAVVESVTGRKTTLSSIQHEKDGLSLILRDNHNFRVSVGNASVSKKGEKISGDSFVSCVSPQGNFVAALSDGMGTGEAASKESTAAIELLRCFIMSGMDIETALELINSSLLLRSAGDSFATMDVCSVDLSAGNVNIFKSGAATSYIKNASEIFKVESDSLPFGVLKNDSSVTTRIFGVEKTAQIVIMSDGVFDVLSWADEDIVEKILRENSTDNPQIIASEILSQALKLSEDTAHDDMTVAVVNVWER